MIYTYFTIFGFNIIMSILIILNYIRFKNKTSKKFFIVQIILIAVFYGLRDTSVGYDTSNVYLPGYNNKDFFLEKGFTLINRIIYFFHASFAVYLFIIALITCINLGVFYKTIANRDKYLITWMSLNTSAAMFLLTNGIRQGLAASFFLLSISIYYLDDSIKNKIIGLIVFVFAMLIHNSIIVFVLFYFVKHKRLSYKELIYILAGAIIFSFAIGFIGFDKLASIIPDPYIKSRLLIYMTAYSNENLTIKFIMHFFNAGLLVYLSYRNVKEYWFIIVRNLYIYMLTLTVLSVYSSETVKRLMWYMSLLIPFIYLSALPIIKSLYKTFIESKLESRFKSIKLHTFNLIMSKEITYKIAITIIMIIYIALILIHPSIRQNFNY